MRLTLIARPPHPCGQALGAADGPAIGLMSEPVHAFGSFGRRLTKPVAPPRPMKDVGQGGQSPPRVDDKFVGGGGVAVPAPGGRRGIAWPANVARSASRDPVASPGQAAPRSVGHSTRLIEAETLLSIEVAPSWPQLFTIGKVLVICQQQSFKRRIALWLGKSQRCASPCWG